MFPSFILFLVVRKVPANISELMAAIGLKLSVILIYTAKGEYLECEAMRCCCDGSRASFAIQNNLPSIEFSVKSYKSLELEI